MLIFKKHFAVIFRCLSMGAFLLCVGILLYSRFGKGWRPLDLDLPEDTGVLIHSSTFTTSGKIELAPRSEIYFYDSTGSLLRDVSVSEEVCGDFIVDSGDDICFFFKNRSVIASVDSAISLGNQSGTTIQSTKFGPSYVNYIDDLQLSYALLNVGRQSQNTPYISILRFVSDSQNYDVIIPYYLEGVYFDAVEKEFVCVIDPMNRIENSGFLDYVVVKYDAFTQTFVYSDTLYHLSNTDYPEDSVLLNSGCLVHDKKLYHAFVVPNDDSNLHGVGDLVLSVYDLQTGEHLSNSRLLESYELGFYGGMMVGSNDFPMITKCEKLYVFASTNQLFVIDYHGQVRKYEMPYTFSDKLHLSSPDYDGYVDKCDFTGSLVHVEDDGAVYILSLFRDGCLRIHKLLESGQYDVVWESTFLPRVDADMVINDFEIVSCKTGT